MRNKVAFYTLGCKLNYSETSTISEQFLKKGFAIAEFEEHADIYVINTCSVTDNTDRECRQIVRRALRKNPTAFIIVTGCYAQLKPDEIAKIEGVDIILGNNEKFKLFDFVNDFTKNKLSCIYVSPSEEIKEISPAYSSDSDVRTRAFLKIQDGCDYKCSYCTIPLARGKSRSLNIEEVVSDFKKLLDNGYKEIILTGVNVGDYGKNINRDLFSLLKNIIDIEGDYRIRISSIEPNLLSDEIIELTNSNDKLCKHFHIPLQNGSAKILKLMQRRYTREIYEKLIYRVVDKIKDVGIGVDVIVGFPGETDADFMDTYNFLNDLPVTYLHAFTYSERPNTKAIDLSGIVEHSMRKKRTNQLRILSDKKKRDFYKHMIGKELEVLFEHENHNGIMKGFASNYVRVQDDYDDSKVNKLTKVRINNVKEGICTTKSEVD